MADRLTTPEEQAERLARLLADTMGQRRGDLRARLRGARRGLPRAVARDIETVAQAAELCGHPAIARQVDAAPVKAAYARAEAWLTGPALREARITARLHWLAGLAGNLLILLGLLLVVLVWRGFV